MKKRRMVVLYVSYINYIKKHKKKQAAKKCQRVWEKGPYGAKIEIEI